MSEDFYEKNEVIREVFNSERSKLCYKIMFDLITKNDSNKVRKRILDIGCGDGSLIRKFKKKCEVFGVDISGKAIRKAREAGINAHRLDVSSEKFPFPDRYFDIVYMGDIVEHLIDPDFAIKEVKRVLKFGSFLVLSTPNLACWYNRLLLLIGIQPVFSEVSTIKIFGRPGTLPVGHLRIYTLNALKEFLKYYGFKPVKIVGASFDKLPEVIKTIDKIFCKIPSLSSVVIVIAKVHT